MTLKLQASWLLYIIVAALLLALLWFAWPTPWEHPSGSLLLGTQYHPLIVRVHRVTGRVEVLTATGWEHLEATKAPAATAPAAQTGPGGTPK